MRIDWTHAFALDAALEREAMALVMPSLAPAFDVATARDRIGLIVAADNAGSATSIQFWAEAMRVGVAVASPELFPWCLANAPCAALSRHFGITGPNATLLGEGDALVGAFDSAAQWLALQCVDHAVVVALSFASATARGQALALRLCSGGEHKRTQIVDAMRDQLVPLGLRAALDMLQARLSASPSVIARENETA